MKFSMGIPIGDINPGEFQTAAAVDEMGQAMEAAGVDASRAIVGMAAFGRAGP